MPRKVPRNIGTKVQRIRDKCKKLGHDLAQFEYLESEVAMGWYCDSFCLNCDEYIFYYRVEDDDCLIEDTVGTLLKGPCPNPRPPEPAPTDGKFCLTPPVECVIMSFDREILEVGQEKQNEPTSQGAELRGSAPETIENGE